MLRSDNCLYIYTHINIYYVCSAWFLGKGRLCGGPFTPFLMILRGPIYIYMYNYDIYMYICIYIHTHTYIYTYIHIWPMNLEVHTTYIHIYGLWTLRFIRHIAVFASTSGRLHSLECWRPILSRFLKFRVVKSKWTHEHFKNISSEKWREVRRESACVFVKRNRTVRISIRIGWDHMFSEARAERFVFRARAGPLCSEKTNIRTYDEPTVGLSRGS